MPAPSDPSTGALSSSGDPEHLALEWEPHLTTLGERLRCCARETMSAALRSGRLDKVSRPVSVGAGDATFGIDEAVEAEVSRWLDERACCGPLSLLTEDAGWRHKGPDGQGGCRALDGFDHGGPRLALDPVDGTRHLMLDMRSAWVVTALAPPGPSTPSQREILLACLTELPDSRARLSQRITACRGAGARLYEVDVEDGRLIGQHTLRADTDVRPDHGYMPFFAFHPELRADVAQLSLGFFKRIEEHEGAELAHCYDDQYICNAGQLVLTAQGTYRMVVEARKWISERRGQVAQTTKPYDIAGALLVAQEAGAVVTDLCGDDLDFPWDATTPVAFVAFTNRGTQQRLMPHLKVALDEFKPLGLA